MAAKSVNPGEMALAVIDEDIAHLQRSRAILVRAMESVKDAPAAEPKVKRTRGKNKPKPGLPAQEGL